MKSLPVVLLGLEVGVRWTARVLTALLVGLVLVMFVGVSLDGGFHPLKLKGVEPIQMVLFWTACVGLVIACRWPSVGGAMSTGGMLHFLAVELAVTRSLPKGLVFHLMLLTGILFMVDGFIRQRMAARGRFSLGSGGMRCPAPSMGVQAAGRTRAQTRPARRRGRGVRAVEPRTCPSPPRPPGTPRPATWAEGER